jgi:hypothetical protein
MSTWDDVARVCLALPETAESTSYGGRAWKVNGKGFVWERPLRRRDLEELGDDAPTGPVLGATVPDEGAKRALIADQPDVYFTTSHFDGYAAVLVRLEAIDEQSLVELAGEAWACRAPRRLLEQQKARPPNG